jgi:hypothetical protein
MSGGRVLEVGCDFGGHRVAELSEEVDGFLPVSAGSLQRAKLAVGAAWRRTFRVPRSGAWRAVYSGTYNFGLEDLATASNAITVKVR